MTLRTWLRRRVHERPAVRAMLQTGPARLARRAAAFVFTRECIWYYRMDLDRKSLPRVRPRADGDDLELHVLTDPATPPTRWVEAGAVAARRMRRRLEAGDVACIAVRGGRTVGQALLARPGPRPPGEELALALADGEAWTYDWFTVPAERGRGVISRCVATLVVWARETGLRRLYVGVNDWNAPSQRAIEALGFERLGAATYRRILGRSFRRDEFGDRAPTLIP